MKNMSEENVQVSFRCTEDYRAELKMEALRRRIDLQTLIQNALRQYLSNDNSTPASKKKREKVPAKATHST